MKIKTCFLDHTDFSVFLSLCICVCGCKKRSLCLKGETCKKILKIASKQYTGLRMMQNTRRFVKSLLAVLVSGIPKQQPLKLNTAPNAHNLYNIYVFKINM